MTEAQAVVRTSSKKAWIYAVLGLVLVLVALVGIKGAQIGAMIHAGKTFVPPPESVTTAKVQPAEWQASRSAPATLVAVRAAVLGAEISGTIREITFESGSPVHKGDVLVRLDTSTEQAQLQAARADQALTHASLERAQALRKSGSNTPADLDAAEARAKSSAAQVATLEATIAKKTIRAPFDGRIAIRSIELGQVVSPGTQLASLQSVSPMHAEFWLPQQALAELKTGMPAKLSTDVYPGQSWDGQVSVINSEVDLTTRNVRVRATFPNADGRLRPGMFANVQVLSPERRNVLLIPNTAALYAPYGDSVFVVTEKKQDDGKTQLVAQQRFVRLGERRGEQVKVESGLQAGETIVSSGAFKLRNGVAVVVHNELAPQVPNAGGEKPAAAR